MLQISTSFRILFCVFLSAACTSGFAQESGFQKKAPHLTATLVVHPERSAVGLYLEPDPGWHVYWQNPGDSGQAPRIEWDLPRGSKPGEIQWTSPERIPFGPLVNYGYEKPVLLFSELKRKLPESGSVGLKARWLVCKEVCVPGKAELRAEVPEVFSRYEKNPSALFRQARAALPSPMPDSWSASLHRMGDRIFLTVTGVSEKAGAYFFPHSGSLFQHSAKQNTSFAPAEKQLTLDAPVSDQFTSLSESSSGVLRLGERHYEIQAQAVVANPQGIAGALQALLFALLGGLILNLMPCVFPVLSIKALGLVTHSEEKSKLRTHGLLYTAGVLVTFWLLTAAILLFREGGESLGWGFQLQSPGFVTALASLLFLFGLNLLGVFEIGSSFLGLGSELSARRGALGAFFTGALAVVVATPCTAPFMGAALGFALSQPGWLTFIIFTGLAVGLALPYLLLSFFPVLAKVLPKPGRWMETFKQLMAFPIFATVVWLLWVLGLQRGTDAIVYSLLGLTLLALAGWMIGRWHGRWPHWAGIGLAILVFAGLTAKISQMDRGGISSASTDASGLQWVPYSEKRLSELLESGSPVFIDFTAAWCVTCQVNKAVALNDSAVLEAFERYRVVPVIADWTNSDPEISKALQGFGRNGVPLYVLYPGGSRKPIILPELLTAGLILDTFEKNLKKAN